MVKKDDKDNFDMFKEYVELDKAMIKAREEVYANAARTNKIYQVEMNKEKVKDEVRNYVNA
jgi:hypothetical protein